MGLFDTLRVAGSGLHAANAGVAVTSHNVANASTDGYHRRRVEQSTADPVRRGALWLGRGTQVDRLARPSDRFLAERSLAATGNASYSQTTSQSLARVDQLFADDSVAHVRTAMDAFFESMRAATLDPSDPSLRLDVANKGEGVAYALNETASGLSGAIEDYDADIAAQLPALNQQLEELASLNAAIRQAGGPLAAGDLADQQAVLLDGISQTVGGRVDIDADGQATVLLGGHAVVSGGEARTVSFAPGTAGAAPRLLVSADGGQLEVTDDVGGALGGFLEARDLASGWLSDLDDLADGLATSLNGQHSAGFDANGNPGGDLFTYSAGSEASTLQFSAAVVGDPSLLAFASDPAATAGDGGNLTNLIDQSNQLTVNNTSPLDFATQLLAEVGSAVRRAGTMASHDEAVAADATELYQSLHSVDLDEEATNLMQYQAAFQAAAKVIATTDQMLGTLMELA